MQLDDSLLRNSVAIHNMAACAKKGIVRSACQDIRKGETQLFAETRE
ncbi:hypothetical protein N9R40_02470 [bacterium]|nr:hypothetical protein [bacterium]